MSCTNLHNRLKIKDKKELHRYNQLAKDSGLKTALITDAGRTVIAPGTETCVAIGPDKEEKIDHRKQSRLLKTIRPLIVCHLHPIAQTYSTDVRINDRLETFEWIHQYQYHQTHRRRLLEYYMNVYLVRDLYPHYLP